MLEVPDYSMDEVVVTDLDLTPLAERDKLLEHYLSKLSPQGEITIYGIDLGYYTTLVSGNSVDVATANSVLEQVKSLVYSNELERQLYNRNMKITYKNIEGFKYIIKARY